jgi:hypothetical protein
MPTAESYFVYLNEIYSTSKVFMSLDKDKAIQLV